MLVDLGRGYSYSYVSSSTADTDDDARAFNSQNVYITTLCQGEAYSCGEDEGTCDTYSQKRPVMSLVACDAGVSTGGYVRRTEVCWNPNGPFYNHVPLSTQWPLCPM